MSNPFKKFGRRFSEPSETSHKEKANKKQREQWKFSIENKRLVKAQKAISKTFLISQTSDW